MPGTVLAPVVFVHGWLLNWSAILSARHSAFLFFVRLVKFKDARYLLIPWKRLSSSSAGTYREMSVPFQCVNFIKIEKKHVHLHCVAVA